MSCQERKATLDDETKSWETLYKTKDDNLMATWHRMDDLMTRNGKIIVYRDRQSYQRKTIEKTVYLILQFWQELDQQFDEYESEDEMKRQLINSYSNKQFVCIMIWKTINRMSGNKLCDKTDFLSRASLAYFVCQMIRKHSHQGFNIKSRAFEDESQVNFSLVF